MCPEQQTVDFRIIRLSEFKFIRIIENIQNIQAELTVHLRVLLKESPRTRKLILVHFGLLQWCKIFFSEFHVNMSLLSVWPNTELSKIIRIILLPYPSLSIIYCPMDASSGVQCSVTLVKPNLFLSIFSMNIFQMLV